MILTSFTVSTMQIHYQIPSNHFWKGAMVEFQSNILHPKKGNT